MKKKQLRIALDALKTIKMTKIEDKPLRNDIIDNHFAMLGEWERFEKAAKKLETVHLGSFEDERREFDELQQRMHTCIDRKEQWEIMREINSHGELRKAIGEYNKAFAELAEEEVEIKLIDRQKFMEEIAKQDFDLELIEALYPMFNN